MSTPKHRTATGTSYFVTTKCWQGRAIFRVPENADILIKTILDYRLQGAYLLHDFVIMPDHLHLILTPSATSSLEKAVQLIKGGSSHRIHVHRKHKMEIWQKGFHDWTIRDLEDWHSKVQYIRLNPVRARLVEKAEDWPYSSASSSFEMDPIPQKYHKLSSGAKAQAALNLASGLKPRPPKDQDFTTIPQGLKPVVVPDINVGPEGPTPKAFAAKAAKS